MTSDTPGRVVLLNGPTSAGKSSLAEAVVARMPTPWFDLPVDLIHSIRSRPDLTVPSGYSMSDDDWNDVFRRSRAGYHRALAGMARAGNNVIGDHVLNEPWRIQDLLQVLEGVSVLLVHVTAPLHVLEARERDRGDREVGTARIQHQVVFAHGDCDLTIDTDRTSLDDAATLVVAQVDDWPADTAFDRLRRSGRART